jgi:excisionase family DNA binding protein
MKQDSILQKLNNLEQLLQQDEKPLSFIEACNYLNLSHSHLYKLTSQGKITFYKPQGKKLFFKKSDLNNFVFRNRKESESEIEQKAIDYVFNGEVKNEVN